MNAIELAAALLGLANIALLIGRSVWNYPFGMAMVALYVPVFAAARLYSDAGLQLFFFAVQIWGWWNWRRAGAADGGVLVERLSPSGRLLVAGAVLPAWALWSAGMARWTDTAFPFWDGAVAALSIAAQILLARRKIENWWLWIAVDAVAIALFAVRGLWPTAALYALFLAMSAWGLATWMRAERRQREARA